MHWLSHSVRRLFVISSSLALLPCALFRFAALSASGPGCSADAPAVVSAPLSAVAVLFLFRFSGDIASLACGPISIILPSVPDPPRVSVASASVRFFRSAVPPGRAAFLPVYVPGTTAALFRFGLPLPTSLTRGCCSMQNPVQRDSGDPRERDPR